MFKKMLSIEAVIVGRSVRHAFLNGLLNKASFVLWTRSIFDERRFN